MKKIRHILALFLVPLVACTDWFDAVPDNGTIPDKKFFGDENAFYNALIDVYTQLRSNDLYGENLTLGMLEFMSQDFIPYDTPIRPKIVHASPRSCGKCTVQSHLATKFSKK